MLRQFVEVQDAKKNTSAIRVAVVVVVWERRLLLEQVPSRVFSPIMLVDDGRMESMTTSTMELG
jgi:hypothetical protein